MEQELEAIYSNGVFTPLESPGLPDNQCVRLTISVPTPEEPDVSLLAWQRVYAGLSEADITEVEHIALNRLVLVTENVAHFQRIPGPHVESWRSQ